MIEGSPAKKDLGTLVDEKQNHPAMCSCSQKAKHLLGCITSSMVSRTREVIVPSVCSCETPPGCCTQPGATSTKGHRLVRVDPEQATQELRGLSTPLLKTS